VSAARLPLRIALVGFGHVGRRFAELLGGPYARVLRAAGVEPSVTAIATANHGFAIAANGLPLRRCITLARRGRSLAALHQGEPVSGVAELIRSAPADVLLELTPLDPLRGEPACSHVRAALRCGLHVVTANKGPVAFRLRLLLALARRQGRLFLHEGAVMDGAPVFNLVERCLPGVRVLGFRGTLNSTTTHILSRMEHGVAPEQALREAQAAGIAEADASNDLAGWDAAVKGCALANAWMSADIQPKEVNRRGIEGLTVQEVRDAARSGKRIRLVTRADGFGRRARVSVGPERLALGDPLAGGAADAVLMLRTDLMGEIGILEHGGSLDQTAYALLADLVTVARHAVSSAGNPRGR